MKSNNMFQTVSHHWCALSFTQFCVSTCNMVFDIFCQLKSFIFLFFFPHNCLDVVSLLSLLIVHYWLPILCFFFTCHLFFIINDFFRFLNLVLYCLFEIQELYPSGIHNSYIILKNLSSVDAKKILKSSIIDLLAFKHYYTIVIFCMYTIRFFVVFVSFYARNYKCNKMPKN